MATTATTIPATAGGGGEGGGGWRITDFDVGKAIGKGRCGHVYLARCKRSGRWVDDCPAVIDRLLLLVWMDRSIDRSIDPGIARPIDQSNRIPPRRAHRDVALKVLFKAQLEQDDLVRGALSNSLSCFVLCC